MAHYSNGVLLLAEAAGQQGRSRLIVAARDLTSPPTATATGAYLGMPGLRETVAELEMLIPGAPVSPAAAESFLAICTHVLYE